MKKYIFALAALFCLTACSDDKDEMMTNEGPATVEFILANDEGDFVTRATGDSYLLSDDFQEPDYLYVFMVLNSAEGRTILAKLITRSNDGLNWSRKPNRYTTSVSFILPDNVDLSKTSSARAYLIASKQPMPLDITGVDFSSMTQSASVTEEKIRNMTFTLNADLNLRDVYSTPFNLREEGIYYVTANSITENQIRFGSGSKPIILYHVAARVDVIWGDGSDFPDINNPDPDPDPDEEIDPDPNSQSGNSGIVLMDDEVYINSYQRVSVLMDRNVLVANNAKPGDVVRFQFKDPKDFFKAEILEAAWSSPYAKVEYKDLVDGCYDLVLTQEMIDNTVNRSGQGTFIIVNPTSMPTVCSKISLVKKSAGAGMTRGMNDTAEDRIRMIKMFNAPKQGYVFKPALNRKNESYTTYSPVELPIDNYDETTGKGRAHCYVIQPEGNKLTIDVYSEIRPTFTVTTDLPQQSQVFATWYKIYYKYEGSYYGGASNPWD